MSKEKIMSANKFKVGDKVKVRKGLVTGERYGRVRCYSCMARAGGRVFTIKYSDNNYYGVEENASCWSDEMLELVEPAKKTLDNLCVGDFIENEYGVRKVLATINECCLLSESGEYTSTDIWYTTAELDKYGYRPVGLDVPEPIIEINGKKYKKTDVDRAIKDLEPIE